MFKKLGLEYWEGWALLAIRGFVVFSFLYLLFGCTPKPQKPKWDCMRFYYGGLDIEGCGPTIKCIYSEDETGSNKICHDTRTDK